MARWPFNLKSAQRSLIRIEAKRDGIWYEGDPHSSETGSLLEPLLAQWVDEGYVSYNSNLWFLPWDTLYALVETESSIDALSAAGIPDEIDIVPRLNSSGSLTDEDLSISISSWEDAAGKTVHVSKVTGALVEIEESVNRLRPAVWRLLDRVARFSRRTDGERDDSSQRLAWAEIRRLAVDAGAGLDTFLFSTVVLAPEKLKIALRRGDVGESRLIEIIPDFEGSPQNWLATFDSMRSVLNRYDLPSPEGIVQVVITHSVRGVLEQIKSMPGRRIAGPRAEAFLANPFAALGPGASDVLDEQQFEEACVNAGLVFERFTAYVDCDQRGYPTSLGLIVSTATTEAGTSNKVPFKSDDEAGVFIASVRKSLMNNLQLCAWGEFEFELYGDSDDQLRVLEDALVIRREPAATFINPESVFDLSMYSERIQDFGTEKSYASPHIARKDDAEGWFPENLIMLVGLQPDVEGGETKYVPISGEQLKEFRTRLDEAKERGNKTVDFAGIGDIPLADAQDIVGTFAEVDRRAESGNLDLKKDKSNRSHNRKSLIIKPNIANVDYIEKRNAVLADIPSQPKLPTGMRPGTELKAHQLSGLAWLQHLFSQSPDHCRGAVLADDMGLGKTLQLLAFVRSIRERGELIPPALVVAPVSLLENWQGEVALFFEASALSVLEVYGDNLFALRVPASEIDQRLRDEGLSKFLRPGWIGSADLVLTTYETLRDHEFSFAAEKWTVVICDEAQKIKNPNAMVTRAAKKLNARFRIACTGTPVENSLADLWCLFDFIQPGLLGALNDFGTRYRRPIEARTDEEKTRVEELRQLIAPQILRRLKKDIASDLPAKVPNSLCRDLKLSNLQRSLYSHAIAQHAERLVESTTTPFKNVLGLLQYLRLLCTDPQRYGLSTFQAEPLDQYRKTAPKLDWLLRELRVIRRREEKALIFCEFRDVQRLLRHYIREDLGLAVEIINGDTPSSSKAMNSRQKRIRAFQDQAGFGAIILSPLAVGFGVNIQAANHVIHYTRLWNPAKEDQATDRAHRIGQTKSVHVYCPIVRAEDFKTFDEKLDELLERKRTLAEDMLNGAGDIGVGEFRVDEVAPKDVPISPALPIAMDDVHRMSPRYFEAFVAALWARCGYSRVVLTPTSGDMGVDVVALTGDIGALIQCKSSSSERALGWDAIKDVVTGEAAYKAQYPGVSFKRVCVTNRTFNIGAREQGVLNEVELVDCESLTQLVREITLTMYDVEGLLHG